jgi:hypothetical protein
MFRGADMFITGLLGASFLVAFVGDFGFRPAFARYGARAWYEGNRESLALRKNDFTGDFLGDGDE